MNNINDTQATETVPAPKSTHNGYPFQTKAQIKELLSEDTAFRYECVGIINGRQTAHEQATLTTKVRNHGGWMSSDAVRMGKVAQKLAAMETLSETEDALVSTRIPAYVKQLAEHFRNEATEHDPKLVEQAAAFFQS